MGSTMPRMTEAGEARLRAALDAVVDLVNEGERPDDAIYKVAADRQVPAGHVRLMVNAYNTGRTTRHRESHSEPAEKAADFPIADPAAILERLYPTQVKSAAAVERVEGVSVEYGLSPQWYRRAKHDGAMEKAAAAVDWRLTDRPVPAYPTVHDQEAGDRILLARQKAAQAADDDRMEAARIQDQITAGFEKLAEYFATPGSLGLAEVRENLETLFGKAGMAVYNQLRRTRPHLLKLGGLARFHSTLGEPYHTVGRIVDLAARLREVTATSEKRAAAARTELEGLEAPFVPARRESLLDPLSSTGAEKAAGGFQNNLGALVAHDFMGQISDTLKPDDRDRVVDKQLAQIATPEHEQDLRNIHTRAMLEDMLADDPIISSYNRDEVLGAFNDLSQLAPRASQQPILMQGLLRKRLQQGALDPFEGDAIVGTENRLKDTGTVPKPHTGAPRSGPPPTSVLAK
jgi:hypothetical protein